MTNVLHWRKMTWALVLWSGYVATWAVITGSGPAIVTLWWLVGTMLRRRALARHAAAVPGGARPKRASSFGPAGRTGARSTSTDPTGHVRRDDEGGATLSPDGP